MTLEINYRKSAKCLASTKKICLIQKNINTEQYRINCAYPGSISIFVSVNIYSHSRKSASILFELEGDIVFDDCILNSF